MNRFDRIKFILLELSSSITVLPFTSVHFKIFVSPEND